MLPSDRYLAQLLGLTDEQFLYFKAEVERRAREQPEPAVVAGVETIIAITLSVIGVGFQLAASFMKPAVPDQRSGKPPELQARTRADAPITNNQRYSPRYGFDSVQDIATLGSTIPVVYALRESIGGMNYGGVRVSAPMLWSQIYSLGGSQMLRAIFMIGEGPMASIDEKNFASGGNTLTSYDFGNATANEIGSRLAVYARYASNLTTRILPSDHVYGRDPATDVGNTNNLTGISTDVFGVRIGNFVTTDFCAAHRPGNQTRFGLYAFCGNDFGMRPSPVFEPQVRAQLRPTSGRDGKAKVKCILDEAKWAQRQKAQAYYGSRSGITSQGLGSIGGTTTYTLYSTSDKDTVFSRDIQDLTNVASWQIDKEIARIETQGATMEVSSLGSGAGTKAVAKYRDDLDVLDQNLLDRFSVEVLDVEASNTVNISWTGVTTLDTKNDSGADQAWIAVRVSFNSAGMSVPELIRLKSARFKISLKNELTAEDPQDDVEVIQYHKIFVTGENQQEIGLTAPSYSAPSLNTSTTSIDGTTVVTGVSLSGGSVTFPELDVVNTIPNLKFAFDRGSGWTAPTASGSFVLVSWFSTQNVYAEDCEDIASVVAGRQKTWDDSLIIGELYKIGTGLAVCTSRTNGPFASDVDGATLTVNATFRTVRTGVVSTNSADQIVKDGKTWLDQWLASSSPEPRNVATTDGHIMRCAIASVSTTRACKVVEFGIKSTLGIRINGIANFNSAKGYTECDERACLVYQGNILNEGDALYTDIHQSGQVSANVERYSFFAISYREAGTTGAFTRLQDAYGVRSATSQPIFNYIQLDMGSVKQWEFQIEPYSGYEVRNHNVGTLYVLDASYVFGSVLNVTDSSGVKVMFTGVAVTKSADTFAITVGRRSNALRVLDYPTSDASYSNGDESFIDTWGKLAEDFVYEEIQSSAESGPEHEIVYINEIVPNATQPLYDNLALVGVNIMSSVEWQQFEQFSCYVTGGKICRRLRNSLTEGATHLFPDVLLDLMTNATYGTGEFINDSMIDLSAFEAAADWCYSRKYFFDGVQADRVNLRQWAADTAAAHLLIFGESDGKFYLRPALQFDAVSIKGLFTAGNIAEGSFKLQYLEPEEREPIQVSVRYREERASTDLTNPGMFPTEREVLVREVTGSATDPIESLDMSDYCTNRDHAIDAAKFIIRMRRIPTHVISFRTTHEGALSKLGPSDYIRVAMDETQYDEFNNGVVTEAGALVSTKPLADGTYTVIAWDGTEGTPPADATLTVNGGGTTATPTGVVFTVKLPTTQVRTYQIERITPDEEGTFSIEAVHMPTNASGVLTLADGFDTAGNWVIEG